MTFEKELIFTGVSKRTSKKTNNEYLLVNFLDEDGIQFSALAECNVPSDLKQLSTCRATFNLKTGQYMGLSVGLIEVA